VDCSNRGLKEIPMEIPTTTTKLVLSDNFIKKIPAFGLFNRFFTFIFGRFLFRILIQIYVDKRLSICVRIPSLEILDLSRNKLEEIEQGAFEGATSIKEM
jgi:hypothetical protein